MRLETRRRWIACGSLALGLSVPIAVPAVQGQNVYQDGAPQGIPPGFEPVDVSADMERIESRRQREIDQEAAIDMDYRRVTPERRMRARYGGATWNMYDPFH